MGNTEWVGEKLYHYTDFTAMHGMIANNEIWLGNVFDMNDSHEMSQFIDLLKKEVILKTQRRDFVEKLFENQIRRLRETPIYIASLSKMREDAAQWDRYGNNGMGVCIGFDADALWKATYKQVYLQSVFYDYDVSQHEHVQLISRYVEDNLSIGEWGTIDSIFDNVWACASAFKHPSFTVEKEVRLVSIPGTIAGKYGEQPRYRISGNMIREYYPLKFKKAEIKKIVTDIIVGPKAKCSIDILKRYLRYETSVDIERISLNKAECPLR